MMATDQQKRHPSTDKKHMTKAEVEVMTAGVRKSNRPTNPWADKQLPAPKNYELPNQVGVGIPESCGWGNPILYIDMIGPEAKPKNSVNPETLGLRVQPPPGQIVFRKVLGTKCSGEETFFGRKEVTPRYQDVLSFCSGMSAGSPLNRKPLAGNKFLFYSIFQMPYIYNVFGELYSIVLVYCSLLPYRSIY